MSEHRLIITGVTAVCALAVACSINPGLAQLVSTTFTIAAVAGGVALAAFVGWFIHVCTTDLPDDELEPTRVAELEREAVR